MTLAPPFAYYGGKTTLAERIVDLLPAHRHYVEPFAGSLAVLLAKPPSLMETVNDLDGHIMTFWRVLRDQPDELMRVCAFTPHSRAEHQAAYDLNVDDDLEHARRVWVLLTQGRGGKLTRTGWRYIAKPTVGLSVPGYLAAYTRRMERCAQRLAGVSLESRDALDVIADYGQHTDVVIYADPPYLGSTRAAPNEYAHEMRRPEQHEQLADALKASRSAVLLSGYDSTLYERLYDGWHTVRWKTTTLQGHHAGGDKTRTEVLWSNRPLGHDHLFGGVA